MSKGGGFDAAGFFDGEHVHEVSETVAPSLTISMILPLSGSGERKSYRVVISVARPVRPRYILSDTGKIYVHTCVHVQ